MGREEEGDRECEWGGERETSISLSLSLSLTNRRRENHLKKERESWLMMIESDGGHWWWQDDWLIEGDVMWCNNENWIVWSSKSERKRERKSKWIVDNGYSAELSEVLEWPNWTGWGKLCRFAKGREFDTSSSKVLLLSPYFSLFISHEPSIVVLNPFAPK